jgi:hypothetical protein
VVSVERDGGVLAVGESSRVDMEKLVLIKLALSTSAHSIATNSSMYHFLESPADMCTVGRPFAHGYRTPRHVLHPLPAEPAHTYTDRFGASIDIPLVSRPHSRAAEAL